MEVLRQRFTILLYSYSLVTRPTAHLTPPLPLAAYLHVFFEFHDLSDCNDAFLQHPVTPVS